MFKVGDTVKVNIWPDYIDVEGVIDSPGDHFDLDWKVRIDSELVQAYNEELTKVEE